MTRLRLDPVTVEATLRAHHGNRKQTARALGVSEYGLRLALQRFGLTAIPSVMPAEGWRGRHGGRR